MAALDDLVVFLARYLHQAIEWIETLGIEVANRYFAAAVKLIHLENGGSADTSPEAGAAPAPLRLPSAPFLPASRRED